MADIPGRVNAVGVQVTTATNPQRLLTANPQRRCWKVFNLSGATDGMLGYDDTLANAAIPLAVNSTPLVGYTSEEPVETNEIWYHGTAGAVLGVVEA